MFRYVILTSCLVSVSTLKAIEPVSGSLNTQPNTKRPQVFKLPPVEKEILPKGESILVKIQLLGVEFSGNTVFDDDQLQGVAKPYIGRAVSLAELEELRLKISLFYSQQGYINSGAILPEQKFEKGIIRFQIVEGRLADIRVSGTEWLDPDYIRKRLRLNMGNELNVEELRNSYQLLLTDPLIDHMNGKLIPGTKRGESILDLHVTRARPYQVNLTANNYRPPSVGSEQGFLNGWIRNLSGYGDLVEWSIGYSEGTLAGSGGIEFPLNAYDTRFNFHFDLSNASVVEEPLDQVDIKSEYTGYEFGLTQPIIKTLNRNLTAGVLFSYKKNETTILGRSFSFLQGAEDGITRDSALRFTLDFSERLEHHVFSARSTTSLGIKAFESTWHQDDSIADSDFVSWLAQLQYAGKVFNTDGILVLRTDIQYADNKLLALERFVVGGRYSVRGYRENEVVRDKGYVLSAEFRYPLLSQQSNSFPGQLTIFPFMDYGAGWNHGESEFKRYLHSVGVGLEWKAVKYLSSEIIYAHDLNKAVSKSGYNVQDSGIHWQMSLSAF